ncbi:histidine kinase [Kitasatospora sp. NPDC094011]|uniref:histidine kinase n=1 Tax=Kitasatospora sp. NPDC094011 TaxID=3364090 RepID=UPI00382CC368
MTPDRFRLMHWMNARKTTPDLLGAAGVDTAVLTAVLDGSAPEVSEEQFTALCAALRVAPEQIAARQDSTPAAVVLTADQLHATRRPIRRAGLHFYNYYTMAAPEGQVAPVILDILCPAGTLPELNNGHLEPAITVNLGPGRIHGRWGAELDATTWRVLEPGDSYVESSYCPHAYSLVDGTPARIVSYTGDSNLAPLLDEANAWGDPAAATMIADLDAGPPVSAVLRAALRRRCFDADSAGLACGVDADHISAFCDGRTDSLDPDELRALGRSLGFDFRPLIEPVRRRDALGKTHLTAAESRAGSRAFASYTATSLAMTPELPDLVGVLLAVDGEAQGLDLADHGENHYLVTAGDLTLHWQEPDGTAVAATLGPDGTAWLAPLVAHSWSGRGTVVKLGSGERLGYLDHLELTNTFAPAATLRRGRQDARGWGYEPGSGN